MTKRLAEEQEKVQELEAQLGSLQPLPQVINQQRPADCDDEGIREAEMENEVVKKSPEENELTKKLRTQIALLAGTLFETKEALSKKQIDLDALAVKQASDIDALKRKHEASFNPLKIELQEIKDAWEDAKNALNSSNQKNEKLTKIEDALKTNLKKSNELIKGRLTLLASSLIAVQAEFEATHTCSEKAFKSRNGSIRDLTQLQKDRKTKNAAPNANNDAPIPPQIQAEYDSIPTNNKISLQLLGMIKNIELYLNQIPSEQ